MQETLEAGRTDMKMTIRLRPVAWAVAVHVGVLLLVFLFLDSPVYKVAGVAMHASSKSLLGLFRCLGRPAGVIFAALLLWRLKKRGARWTLTLILAVSVSGLVAEGLSRSVCRVRPKRGAGRAIFAEPFSRWERSNSPGASFPSGDVSVAVALATVLAAAAPRGKWVFFTLALGTAYWRVVNASHFVSDVYMAGVIGYYIGLSAISVLCPAQVVVGSSNDDDFRSREC